MDSSSRIVVKEKIRWNWAEKEPGLLKILASKVKFPEGNNILHQFVLDNSNPNYSGSENYINACLLSMLHVSVNDINDQGYTPLCLAVLKNNPLMVKKLLSCLKKIDVNRNHAFCRNTALHLAAIYGYLPIMQKLLDNGACLDRRNSAGKTALCVAAESVHFAVESDKFAILECLVKKGANVNNESRYGLTPLHYAAKNGNSTVVTLLVNLGANVNAKDENYETVLHTAALSGDLSAVKKLVTHGANVNVRNKYNFTVLHRATESTNLDIIKFLLEKGVNVPHNNGAFYNAILNGPEAVAKLLF